MKTAMKEMIQNIIDIESKTYNQEQLYILAALKVSALMLLEKEKEQIINAANQNVFVGNKVLTKGENYYNQTYNQNN